MNSDNYNHKALFGKTLSELQDITRQLNLKPFVAKQLTDWLYKQGVDKIESMTNISLKTRQLLIEEGYCIGLQPYKKKFLSQDGTKKYLFEYSDNVFIEAVSIFDNDRTTLCISSQAGCKMNCAFCATGKQGFQRNLSANEILNIYRSVDEFKMINNIVFMGMGEPLDNYQQVNQSIDILTSDYGYALSPHRITLSSAGYIPFLRKIIENTNVNIAISLHNAIAEQRQQIMPIEKAYPIKDVVDILKDYNWKGQRTLTFEYILFENLNSTNLHIKALCQLLNGLACKINLIKFHTIEGTPFVGASRQQIEAFAQKLQSKGFNARIRASKGEDILAACGLLSTKELNQQSK